MTRQQKHDPITVVIDPGRYTGVAVFFGRKLTTLKTFKWQKLVDIMRFMQGYAEMGARFVIEEAAKGAPRIRRNSVAQVRQKAHTLEALAQGFGAHTTLVPPQYKFTKLTKTQFETYFPQFAGQRSSNHSRDAAMLGWVILR